MKRLALVSALFLVVLYPTIVLAGDIFSTANADFYNESFKLKATGTASISFENNKWMIALNFSGLMKNKEYVFNISAQDQLKVRYDIPVTSNKLGNINQSFTITDLVTNPDAFINGNVPYSQHDIDEHFVGYTILRLLDLSGASAGIKLTSLEPTSETNPYLPTYPKGTMVMRARQDNERGTLTFK
jgi:hypothetical protein